MLEVSPISHPGFIVMPLSYTWLLQGAVPSLDRCDDVSSSGCKFQHNCKACHLWEHCRYDDNDKVCTPIFKLASGKSLSSGVFLKK